MLLSNAELREKVNVHQDKPLIRWLNEHRVAWMKDGKGKPITTLSAIEEVLLKKTDDNEVDF